MENCHQTADEELTGQGLSTFFPAQGSISSQVVQTETTPEQTDTGETDTEEPSEPISQDLNAVVQEIEQLQVAAAQALAENPPDWLEFGEIQSQIQDLLTALTTSSGN